MTDLLDLMGARDAGRAGMQRVGDHADRVDPGWSDRAYGFLTAYAQGHREFTAEKMRAWSHGHGLAEPVDLRAWGGVVQRAVRAGVLTRIGAAPAASSHCSPMPLWRSNLCPGEGRP